MSSLLKRIQKNSPTNGIGEILISDQQKNSHSQKPAFNAAEERAKKLLSEIAKESNKAINAPIGANLPKHDDTSGSSPKSKRKRKSTIILRRSNNNTDGNKQKQVSGAALPKWLTDPSYVSSKVDALIKPALEFFCRIESNAVGHIELEQAVKDAVKRAVEMASEELPVTRNQRRTAELELLNLVKGKGPLAPLFEDVMVTDVYIDSHAVVKAVRRGQIFETPFRFRSPEEYRLFINSLLRDTGLHLNTESPIIDCVLNDSWHSRVNGVDSSLIGGAEPRLVLKIPRVQNSSFFDILQSKVLPPSLASWLAEVVSSGKVNILIAGEKGAGKTLMCSALLSSVGSEERVISVEEYPEIFSASAHLEKLSARMDDSEGRGGVGVEELLRAACRRSPQRIVLGELIGKESQCFLEALESGFSGSVTTVNAESVKHGLWRMLDLVATTSRLSESSLLRRISRSINLVILMKAVKGVPCIAEVAEVLPGNGDDFVTKSLVSFYGEVDRKRQWQLNALHSKWIDFIEEHYGVMLQSGSGLKGTEELSKDRD